jgi:acyl-CoA dehydrogenase
MTLPPSGLLVVLALLALAALIYAGRGYLAWVAAAVLGLAAAASAGLDPLALRIAGGVLVVLALVFGLPALRRPLVSRLVMRAIAPMIPSMSQTERTALEAGTVWWDGELFSGRPRWKKLLDFEKQPLSERERAFMDGPVAELCRMVDDWQIALDADLSPAVWGFMKRNRFFGMIIPEEYDGLGFSARAHSDVIVMLSSRSGTAAVTAMVPNSLGPGELLLHYGTAEQKRHYLPRLARGEEIPCFALTGPEAGSDAAATRSVGVVCRGTWEGREVLGMRLDWNKRYITLSPVATLVGLAFRLLDPDHLLGDREDVGITCALIPSHLPGVEIGRRHDPLGAAFLNGPTTGKGVFVPLEAIIGGREMAGQGWRMLMESLAAGRSISLPALAVAGAQTATRLTGAYGTVREQFGVPIGRFEGIEEPLARIAGHAYLMDAARTLIAGAVDAGEKPAVLSAVVKAYLTEGMRRCINDGMDIRAGAGVCQGPRNLLGRAYASLPIAITVEGANILTRTLIVFGQGAIRCHPYAHAEMEAVRSRDLVAFDRAFFGHVGFVARNVLRSLVLGLSGGRLGKPVAGEAGAHLARLGRMSAAFAVVCDAAMGTLGGDLKRREKLSGRLADVLAWLYLGSAAVKRFVDEGQPKQDAIYMRWSVEHALYQIQDALRGVLDNLPNRPVAWLLRPIVFPLGARLRPPSDRLGARVARSILDGKPGRLRLSRDVYSPGPEEQGLGRLEVALAAVVEAQPVLARIKQAIRQKKLRKAAPVELLDAALEAGLIDAAERDLALRAEALRDEVIQVDAFDAASFRGGHHRGAPVAEVAGAVS